AQPCLLPSRVCSLIPYPESRWDSSLLQQDLRSSRRPLAAWVGPGSRSAKFFENSLEELVRRNPALQQNFRRIDANRFTASAYREGEKVCRGSASLGGATW